jgi:hypothetical protein
MRKSRKRERGNCVKRRKNNFTLNISRRSWGQIEVGVDFSKTVTAVELSVPVFAGTHCDNQEVKWSNILYVNCCSYPGYNDVLRWWRIPNNSNRVFLRCAELSLCWISSTINAIPSINWFKLTIVAARLHLAWCTWCFNKPLRSLKKQTPDQPTFICFPTLSPSTSQLKLIAQTSTNTPNVPSNHSLNLWLIDSFSSFSSIYKFTVGD